jgi:protein neuralized
VILATVKGREDKKMGNTNPTGRGPGDLGANAMKGWPILFHQMHSENIQLSLDRRRAKRIESFCKGISFSNRPIAINERVYLKFAEISTSWSGVVRFGFSSNDPATLNPADLPRYACPDLTNKPGYWAKALPERFAESQNTLFFYVSRSGDVMFGLNGDEKGVFFGGVNTNATLWGLVDIYGNTTAMEFVDGRQLNNLSPSSGIPAPIGSDLTQAVSSLSLSSTGAPSTGGSSGYSIHAGGLPVR